MKKRDRSVTRFKTGDRIELIEMVSCCSDEIAPGTRGTVVAASLVRNAEQITVDWDRPRRLTLVCPPDRIKVVPHERNYTFDVKLFASVTVSASCEADAREMITKALDGADANFGSWPNGDPILAQVSPDGEHDLIEEVGHLDRCADERAET